MRWARPSLLARRIARNTQLVLLEESNLGRVVDPAGGCWYVETLTEELALKAWALVQEIERRGGMLAGPVRGLAAGLVGRDLARERQRRHRQPGASRSPASRSSRTCRAVPGLVADWRRRQEHPVDSAAIPSRRTGLGEASSGCATAATRPWPAPASGRACSCAISGGRTNSPPAPAFATNLFEAGGFATV